MSDLIVSNNSNIEGIICVFSNKNKQSEWEAVTIKPNTIKHIPNITKIHSMSDNLELK